MVRFFLLAVMSILITAAQGGEIIRLATTTSTENSGLIQYLLPDFEQACDCQVRVIVGGSGKALAFGRNGDVDVILTHSPLQEKEFVAQGFGLARHPVMYNDFVIIGPPNDPANLAQQPDIVSIMQKIAQAKIAFISRGDDSGTHNKEQELWQLANIQPSGKNYIESGSGMGQTLKMAEQLNAYTLSDRGTFLAFADNIQAQIVPLTTSPVMQNPYSIIVINPAKHPHVNVNLAQKFAKWLTSNSTQHKIANYRQYGEALFFPYKQQ